MFGRIKSLFRKGANNILGSPELFDVLGIEVPVSQKMQDSIKLWTDLHENKKKSSDKKSINVASTIANELARLVTVEMQSAVSGSPRADFLNDQYQHVIKKSREFTEFACARGDLILKPYLSGDKVLVSYVKSGDHYPLAFDSDGYSTSELFFDSETVGDKTYIKAEIQTFTGNAIEIENKIVVTPTGQENYRLTTFDRAPIEKWKNIAPFSKINNVERPLWGHFKMPFANTVDSSSPLGVSVFARAAELIEDANEQYGRYLWEFKSGERALYAQEDAFRRDKQGRYMLPDERLFKAIDIDSEKGLFEAWTPELRDESINRGLNEMLSLIEKNCGLSSGFLAQLYNIVARTATEVKSTAQDTHITVKDISDALDKALEDLVYAMDVWATIGGLAPAGTYEVYTEHDDSVLIDAEEEYKKMEGAAARGWLKAEFVVGALMKKPTKTPEDLEEIRNLYMPDMADTLD